MVFFYSSLSVQDKTVQTPEGLIPHWLLSTQGIKNLLLVCSCCTPRLPLLHTRGFCSVQRGWSCLGCTVPVIPPAARARAKPQPLNVLPAAPQGWGQVLPGSPEAGLAFARSWGDGGEAGGKASLLSAHLLPHQPLCQGTGTSPPQPHTGMQWDGEPGRGALPQPPPLPSSTRNGQGHHHSIPRIPGPKAALVPSLHSPAPSASCLPPALPRLLRRMKRSEQGGWEG